MLGIAPRSSARASVSIALFRESLREASLDGTPSARFDSGERAAVSVGAGADIDDGLGRRHLDRRAGAAAEGSCSEAGCRSPGRCRSRTAVLHVPGSRTDGGSASAGAATILPTRPCSSRLSPGPRSRPQCRPMPALAAVAPRAGLGGRGAMRSSANHTHRDRSGELRGNTRPTLGLGSSRRTTFLTLAKSSRRDRQRRSTR
jgi:hypothetical protein